MVQAGIFSVTAVEQPIAERWAKVMPSCVWIVICRCPGRRHALVCAPRYANAWREHRPFSQAGYRDPADQDAAFQRVYRRLHKVHYLLGRTERQRLNGCARCCSAMPAKITSTGWPWLPWFC